MDKSISNSSTVSPTEESAPDEGFNSMDLSKLGTLVSEVSTSDRLEGGDDSSEDGTTEIEVNFIFHGYLAFIAHNKFIASRTLLNYCKIYFSNILSIL